MILSVVRRLVSLGMDAREPSDLDVMREENVPLLASPMDRREFGRRIFAMGAGFAVGGALIRAGARVRGCPRVDTLTYEDMVFGMAKGGGKTDATIRFLRSRKVWTGDIYVSDGALAKMLRDSRLRASQV